MKASLLAMHNSTPVWVKLLLPAVLTGLLTWGASVSSHDRDLHGRVEALEQSKDDSTKRLDRIENKLDWFFMQSIGAKAPEKH